MDNIIDLTLVDQFVLELTMYPSITRPIESCLIESLKRVIRNQSMNDRINVQN